MQIIKSSLLVQSCLYDFSKDGGAIGIIQTSLIIPNGAQIILVSWNVLEDTFSTGIEPDIVIQKSTGTNLAEVYSGSNPLTIADSGTEALIKLPISNGLPLILNITGEALISGKIIFSVTYILGKGK